MVSRCFESGGSGLGVGLLRGTFGTTGGVCNYYK